MTSCAHLLVCWQTLSHGQGQHFSKLLQKRAGSAKVLTKNQGKNWPVPPVFAKGSLRQPVVRRKPEEPKLNWRLLVPHRHCQDRWRPPAFTSVTILGRSFWGLWSVCRPEAEVDVTCSRDIAFPHRIFLDPGRDRLPTVLNNLRTKRTLALTNWLRNFRKHLDAFPA